MKLSITKLAVYCALSSVLVGCSANELLSSENKITAAETISKPITEPPLTDKIKNIISGESSQINDDMQVLKEQLQQQQQRLETMNQEQQALQEQLKRQSIELQIYPTATANAGRSKVGTASTAYVAFLEDENQFTELEDLASKEISIIPNRSSTIKLNIPQDAQFIAIKVGLRYTKKRSQLLIPLSSIDYDKALKLNIGACDVNIEQGMNPELVPTFTTKLKYYQQPLVSCS